MTINGDGCNEAIRRVSKEVEKMDVANPNGSGGRP